MVTSKKIPWISLVLLLVTYISSGWVLSATHASRNIWLMAAVSALLIAAGLTSAFPVVRDVIQFALKSDARAFLVVSVTAFLSVFIITWISLFANILVVISASSLARLDLQAAKFSQWQAFGILSIISLAGLGLGVIAQNPRFYLYMH